MATIKVLDEHMISLIAAGEVIERMASVVKELVENSIDAKATSINISLVESGIKEIVVSDNGIGMDEVNIKRAILPHSTSKISTADDLFSISTLGFRGEALASIISVSNVTIKSSTGTNRGMMLGIRGGVITSEAYIGFPKGTEIQVRDLFFNTPARLQNLKSQNVELSYIVDFVSKIAMANPDIAFKLTNNGTKIFQSFGNNNLLEVISSAYDVGVAKNMITLANSDGLFKISGFISNISVSRSSRNHMTLIVNGRVVRSNNIFNAIIEGYNTLLMSGRYPICVIDIIIDYSLIDVNVHPTKAEVRFSEEPRLLKLIKETVCQSLLRVSQIVNNETSYDNEENNAINDTYNNDDFNDDSVISKEEVTDNKTTNTNLYDDFEKKEIDFESSNIVTNTISDNDYEKIEENEPKPIQTKFDFSSGETFDDTKEIDKLTELHYVGQLFGTYILAQNDDTFYLIDQHAANERVNYEKIVKDLKKEDIVNYEIMIPIKLNFTPAECILINEQKDVIGKLGIEIEDFGGGSFIVRKVPLWISKGNVQEFVEEIIIKVINGKKTEKYQFLDSLAKSLACKKSIKGNEFLSKTQIDYLLEDLVKCDNPYTCPHGRPIIIKYSKTQVERWFKRVL